MSTLLLLTLLTLAIFVSGTDFDLEALEHRTVNSETDKATFTESNLQSPELSRIFGEVGAFPIVIEGVTTHLDKVRREFAIDGRAELFAHIDADVKVAAFIADKSVGGAVRAAFKGEWTIPSKYITESWMEDLRIYSGEGSISWSSLKHTFYDGTEVGKDVTVHVSSAFMAHDANLALSSLLKTPLPAISMDVLARIALKSTSKSSRDPDEDTAVITLDTSLGLLLHSCVKTSSLIVHVEQMSRQPSMQLQALLVAQFSDNPEVKFEVKSDWNPSGSRLHFNGGLADGSAWAHPFGLSWLSIDEADADVVMNVSGSSNVLESFSATGKGRLVLPRFTDETDYDLNTFNGATDVVFVTCSTMQSIEEVVVDMLDLPASTITSLSALTLGQGGLVQIAIATADTSVDGFGDVQRGLTLAGKGTFHGKVGASLNGQKDQESTDVSFSIYIPVFDISSGLRSVKVALSADSSDLSPTVKLFDISLQMTALKATDVAVKAKLTLEIPHNPSGLSLDVSGDWTQACEAFTLAGDLATPWNEPFNLKWMQIDAVNVALTLSELGLKALSLSGSSQLHFERDGVKISVDSSITGSADDDFEHYSFEVPVEIDTVSPLLATVSGSTASSLVTDSLDVKGTLDVKIATASGLTVAVPVAVKTISELSTRLAAFSLGSVEKIPDMSFELALFVPVFKSNPIDGIEISLSTSSIQIRENIRFDGVKLGVDISLADVDISMATGVSVKFARQPDYIDFAVKGAIDVKAECTLTGAMVGEWHNVFGLTGVDFGDTFLEVGFSPLVPTGLVKIGLGAKTSFGETEVQFDGIVDIESPTDLYLISEVEHLELAELCLTYNKANPSEPQIDVQLVPDAIDFKELLLQFAPRDKTIDFVGRGVVEFKSGLGFVANARLFKVDLDVKMHLDLDVFPFDFGMYLHYDDGKGSQTLHQQFMAGLLPEHYLQPPPEVASDAAALAEFNHELSFAFFHLRSMTVDDFSTKLLSHGVFPRVTMSIVLMNKPHTFSFQLKLPHWMSSFEHLVASKILDLPSLLHVHHCVTDYDCSGRQRCERSSDFEQWYCVDVCSVGSGDAGFVGCLPCFSSAECSSSSSAGACCNNGSCTAPAHKDQVCGMCDQDRTCTTSKSGCSSGFCRRCQTSQECMWVEAAGPICSSGSCGSLGPFRAEGVEVM